jgi:hypothetical protein
MHNLRKVIGENRPVKFRRWQQFALNYLPALLESRLGQRAYLSMWLLDRMCQRYYIEPVYNHAQRAITKQLALRRPGCSTDLHAAFAASALDPCDSPRQATAELFELDYQSSSSKTGYDTDDEDDLLLFGHRLQPPGAAESEPSRVSRDSPASLNLILPSDCLDKGDLDEISRLKKGAEIAGVKVYFVPGKLNCHEEFADATASVIKSILA